MPKIMIIEDDAGLRNQIKEVLIGYGYEVYVVESFRDVEEQYKRVLPQLIILDINLPYYDGNYYCRMIRKHSKIPIVITSARNSDLDQILSIELGADDYIVKPFNIQILIAKINALVRRLYGDYSEIEKEKETVVNGLTLDHAGCKICYQSRQEELSKNEYKLLNKFLQNAGKVISREELLEELWDESSFVDDNTLTVNVTRIKGKLADIGITEVIKTKRGAGYLFDISAINPSTVNPDTINPGTISPSTTNQGTTNQGTINPSTINKSIVNPSILDPSTINSNSADARFIYTEDSVNGGTV